MRNESLASQNIPWATKSPDQPSHSCSQDKKIMEQSEPQTSSLATQPQAPALPATAEVPDDSAKGQDTLGISHEETDEVKKDDQRMTEELFEFLQGNVPEGNYIRRSHVPRLTPDQAWTVIWFLGNQYWQVTDHVDRCDVCGTIYDAYQEGEILDFGKAPYHFCEQCRDGEEANKKRASRLNPENQKLKVSKGVES